MVAEERPSPSEWWCHFHWCCVLIRFRQSSKNLLHLWDQIFFFFWQTELPPSWNFWACALGIRRHEKHRPIRAQLTSHPPPPLTTFFLPPGPPGHIRKPHVKPYVPASACCFGDRLSQLSISRHLESYHLEAEYWYFINLRQWILHS